MKCTYNGEVCSSVNPQAGLFLKPSGMVYDNFFWPLLILVKYRIHFWGGNTHRADSITPIVRVILKTVVGRGDLQFYAGSEPWWGPDILHFSKVLSLAEVNTSVCEQKNMYTDLTGDQTQNLWMRVQCHTPRPLGPLCLFTAMSINWTTNHLCICT